jgi:hypothetical protein
VRRAQQLVAALEVRVLPVGLEQAAHLVRVRVRVRARVRVKVRVRVKEGALEQDAHLRALGVPGYLLLLATTSNLRALGVPEDQTAPRVLLRVRDGVEG